MNYCLEFKSSKFHSVLLELSNNLLKTKNENLKVLAIDILFDIFNNTNENNAKIYILTKIEELNKTENYLL